MRTNIIKVFGLIGLALFLASAAHADGTTANMLFTGANGANDGQYYVSPYSGTMNGAPVTLFCDDLLHEVYVGETWTANVTNLGTAIGAKNFSNTRFGSGISAANATVLYEEVAWLVTQFTPADQSQWVNIQHALWDLTDSAVPYTDSAAWTWYLDAKEINNYGGINANNFLIVTDQNFKYSGSVQEFIVQTPEPSSLVLLVSAMLGMMLLVIRRGRI